MHEKAEKMNTYEQDQLIMNYQNMLHKILHRLSIHQYQSEYEDYLQILSIQLWQASKDYPSIQAFQEDYPVNRLWQLLYWRAQDYRRTVLKLPDTLDEIQLNYVFNQQVQPSQSDERILLAQFFAQLNTKEQKQLLKLCSDSCSRQLRAYYRQKLRSHFEQFLQND